MKFKIFVLIISYALIITNLLGCEAFVRKFTRKPKKDESRKEEMILVPEEYKGSQMSREELYRQYFMFWRSWQDELINYLSKGANHKKQVNCITEAIKNLVNLRPLLNEYKRNKLDTYISQLNDLKSLITQDVYGNNFDRNRQKAERIKRNILKDFSYPEVKNDLA